MKSPFRIPGLLQDRNGGSQSGTVGHTPERYSVHPLNFESRAV